MQQMPKSNPICPKTYFAYFPASRCLYILKPTAFSWTSIGKSASKLESQALQFQSPIHDF